MAVALVAVAANLRIAITSVPPLLDAISTDLGLSHAAAGALTTLRVLCMGVFAPVASRIAHRTGAAGAVLGAVIGILAGTASRFAGDNVVVLYAGTFVCGVGIAVAGTLLPRLVKTFFPPERAGLVTGLYMLAMMGGAAFSSAISVPLSDRLGSWQASLGSWSVVALVGMLAWAPFAVRANPHHTPGEAGPGRLPWGHPTAWLVAGYLAIWLAPTAAPWAWAVVTGLGQGAAFSLALVLLVRYARTPEASGRLTGMAFLISYGLASIGPLAMGLVRDVTGSLSLVWGILAAIGVVQLFVVQRLRPDLRRVE